MTLDELYATVQDRYLTRPGPSSTLDWLDKGSDAIGRKLLEEAAESWMAAKFEGPDAVRLELSQVLYFSVLLMVSQDVALQEVLDLI